MTGDEVIAALDLPASARVERRVPKTLLLDHGAPTAADRRRINEGIEHIQWAAVLKPATIGIAAYRDAVREYLEIAVLRIVLRTAAKVSRLLELVHRAVPYPVVAVTELEDRTNLSVAHKRWSQGEAEKTVIEEDLVAVDSPPDGNPNRAAFVGALALGHQPQSSLFMVYEGWVDVLLALEAARRTGRFEMMDSAECRVARRQALRDCTRLEVEIARLRSAATKEKQMARQVELNLELTRIEAARAAALAKL